MSAGAFYLDVRGAGLMGGVQAPRGREKSLRAAAEQLEAVFVQMMLKSMRQAKLVEDPFSGPAQELYESMLDGQLAMELASRQRLGIAEAVVRQLAGAAKRTAPAEPARRPVPAARGPDFGSASEFVAALRPHAERAARALGVPAEALLAQAALETGWGQKVLRRPDGRSTRNLFNIKADGRWGGERVTLETVEYREGVAVRERAAFRAYGSWREAFDDYVAFVKGSPRYAAVLAGSPDAAGYLRRIAQAGYATDPQYAEKAIRVLGALKKERFMPTVGI